MKLDSTPKTPIKVTTKWEHTNVITGATITLTTADARALYALTTVPMMTEDDDWQVNMNIKRERCRTILRNIAKTILYSSGDMSDIDELEASFRRPDLLRNDE